MYTYFCKPNFKWLNGKWLDKIDGILWLIMKYERNFKNSEDLWQRYVRTELSQPLSLCLNRAATNII